MIESGCHLPLYVSPYAWSLPLAIEIVIPKAKE